MPNPTFGVENLNACKPTVIGFLFSVSPQKIAQWLRAGCPRNMDRTYNARDVIAWKMEQLGDIADIPGGEGKFTEDQLRRQKAMADISEIQAAVARGDLVSKEVVRIKLMRMALIIRGAVEMLQREYGQEAANIIDEALVDYQRELDAGVETTVGGAKITGESKPGRPRRKKLLK